MSQEVDDFLSFKNQRRFIKKLLTDHKFYTTVYDEIQDEDFSEDFQLLVSYMQKFYKQHIKPPTDAELDFFIEARDDITKEDKDRLSSQILDIMKEDISDIQNEDLWLENFKNFIKKSRLIKMLYEGAEYIDPKSKTKKTYYDFARDMSNIANIDFKKTKSHDYIKDAEERFRFFANYQQQRVESDIELLNSLGFGDYGTLSLFLGETNIGKCFHGSTVISVYVEDETIHQQLKEWTSNKV